jgi:hypothetical protein
VRKRTVELRRQRENGSRFLVGVGMGLGNKREWFLVPGSRFLVGVGMGMGKRGELFPVPGLPREMRRRSIFHSVFWLVWEGEQGWDG